MPRYFNKRPVELLAPAGNFDVFKEIVKTRCDAIYMGGKKLNMRMHRHDFNLTHDELKEAINLAHERDKKIYITLNNLHSDYDLTEMTEFLHFLNEVKPDALIVQDMSVIKYVNDHKLNLSLHASVMMNVHNYETVKALEKLGVSRVVMARECSLAYIKAMSYRTALQFEYFVHGDMCGANGSSCYYSAHLFGKSSNRGLCLKPCRWNFNTKQKGKVFDTAYPLAVKDISLYEHIPELIHNNITSFKMEGRMRTADYLQKLITVYADALDRYLDNPLYYDRQKEAEFLYENRKRDLTTFYAFGNPGISHINQRFEGTGTLYSTGKMFSTATTEANITTKQTLAIKEALKPYQKEQLPNQPTLSVSVGSYEAALKCLELGVTRLYCSEITKRDELADIISKKKKSQIYLTLPAMSYDNTLDEYEQFLNNLNLPIDGLQVANLGAAVRFKELGYTISGDYFFNIYNSLAAKSYETLALSDYTASIEAPAHTIAALLRQQSASTELLVWGFPQVMMFEHSLDKNSQQFPQIGQEDEENEHRLPPFLYLVDSNGGQHPVYKTQSGNYSMSTIKPLSLIPVLAELRACGLHKLRLNCLSMPPSAIEVVVSSFKEALNSTTFSWSKLDQLYPNQSYGAFSYVPKGEALCI